ncbi:MAG: hypothetical protein ACJA2N_001253, partial [Salibacteraceae bacterium]
MLRFKFAVLQDNSARKVFRRLLVDLRKSIKFKKNKFLYTCSNWASVHIFKKGRSFSFVLKQKKQKFKAY